MPPPAPSSGKHKVVEKPVRVCEGCGAAAEFDPATGGLKCSYCGVEKVIPRAAPLRHPLQVIARLGSSVNVPTTTLQCTNCGAVASVASNRMGTSCAFCMAPLVAMSRLAELPAEAVLPFSVTRAAAAEHLQAWARRLWFRPLKVKRLSTLREVRGVYVPHWVYDATAHSDWSADAGHEYEQEGVAVIGGEEQTVRERQTRWENAWGVHDKAYGELVVSASAGLPPRELAEIEPFPLGDEVVRFQRDFVAGFEAERPAFSVLDGWLHALRQIVTQEEGTCEQLVPGTVRRNLRVSTATTDERALSLLLPVYVAAYEHGGQVYRVLINGCTGKITGQAPLSWWRIGSLAAGVVAAAAMLLASWL